MNESETRAEYTDPQLRINGWGKVDGSKVLREFRITDGKIQVGGGRGKPDIADYVLVYRNRKIGVIEAKKDELEVGEGVGQAKAYAAKLGIDYAFATNGREIYQMSLKTGKENLVDRFPTPDELWAKTFSDQNDWKDRFDAVPSEGDFGKRYYQEIAISRTLDAIAEERNRILLTLATGTGKTVIAFQIAWKLFHAHWNLRRDGKRLPRILFLADRNILANQAFNSFSAFPEDALVRINPSDIRKKGGVPTNGSIFFTIFQTFMTGPGDTPYYGDYPADFFDLIIVDECHRGGANDESTWRSILEYFSPAVHVGLTATPKRHGNVDTYKYFGDPIYTYSLKEGINDGFLTPFKVRRIKTTMDDYLFTFDDEVVEGDVEVGKLYEEADFNKIIEIKPREEKRVKILLDEIKQNEKTIVFCANQAHAALVRDLINQNAKSKDPNYCVRVTANDGVRGDQFLAEFQDNEKMIPTILTTSQKLSTGVDARNVRNIALMRPVNSMIEFKQIIGRGTRLFDGKEYFTILDFVDAYKHFSDPAWDGEPIDETSGDASDRIATENSDIEKTPVVPTDEDEEIKKKKIIIRLADGKDRQIQHMISTSFWGADGKPVSAEEFLREMFGVLDGFFTTEDEFVEIWSDPVTRKAFLVRIAELGYNKDQLENLQKMIDAEDSDLFDVLSFIAFATPTITRRERVEAKREIIEDGLNNHQREFIDFVLSKYQESGSTELAEEKLPQLLNLKYETIMDANQALGGVEKIRATYFGLQRKLYSPLRAKRHETRVKVW